MFPGGGAQYCGAARGLCLQLPEFKQHVDACLRALDPKTAAAVTRLIHLASDQVTDADRDLAERPSVGLPMLFAISCYRSVLDRAGRDADRADWPQPR